MAFDENITYPDVLKVRSQSSSGFIASEAIDIDVGGRAFRVGASTLRKAPFFEALLRHMEAGTMDSTTTSCGVLFVDRSPELFPKVLGFLRSGLAFSISAHEAAILRSEFEFFGLNPEAVQSAPGSRCEEVVLGVRWKHVDMTESDRVYIYVSLNGPQHVLNSLEGELTTVEQDLQWERQSRILCYSVTMDQPATYLEVPKLMAPALEALWSLGFSESGRAESSTFGYDSRDDARVHWISETVTLKRWV